MQEKRLNCVVIISKSRWWQAPVTTSKDKKTKQIVEIFRRGQVVWRHTNLKKGGLIQYKLTNKDKLKV